MRAAVLEGLARPLVVREKAFEDMRQGRVTRSVIAYG